MLWLKSRNSEVWLERHTGYTRLYSAVSFDVYILMAFSSQMLNFSCGRSGSAQDAVAEEPQQ